MTTGPKNLKGKVKGETMRFIYIPLERYSERYTEWLSGENGAVERQLKALKIPFISIRPHNNVTSIKTGFVLDAQARQEWAFEQTKRLCAMIVNKEIDKDDKIFFDDFWHPGMEMIPYTMSLVYGCSVQARDEVWPQMYAFNYAQSVDPNDFTHPWKDWIRDFETAWAYCFKRLFVSCPEHADLMGNHGWSEQAWPVKVSSVGLMYDSESVRRMAPTPIYQLGKANSVVWSSRWDKEKNPNFFMDLVSEVMKERQDIVFKVCSGFTELKSNDYTLVERAKRLSAEYKKYFHFMIGLPKSIYYRQLQSAKVQFNAADQDWVSFTLLEATTFNCAPLYPDYLSFPAALEFNQDHLYEKGNLQAAKEKLYKLLEAPAQDYSWVYRKYEDTLKRILNAMGFNAGETIPLRFTK